MEVPLELSFRGVEKTRSLEQFIHEQVRKIEEVSGRVLSCRIAVERRNQHQESGSGFRVRIQLHFSHGPELVIRREPGEGGLHDDLRAVLKEAFRSARRRARETDRKQRGETKTHLAADETGLVERIFHEESYGFIRSLTGREIYFHENSVLHGEFRRLKPGTEVRFVTELGEEGLQASTVERLGQPGQRTARGAESAA